MGVLIGKRWSGWHGYVIWGMNGEIDILVHHLGDYNKLREVHLRPRHATNRGSRVFLLYDDGGTRAFTTDIITTRIFSQRQIAARSVQGWTMETVAGGRIDAQQQQQHHQRAPPNITIIDTVGA